MTIPSISLATRFCGPTAGWNRGVSQCISNYVLNRYMTWPDSVGEAASPGVR